MRNISLADRRLSVILKLVIVLFLTVFTGIGCDELNDVDNDFMFYEPPPEPRYTDSGDGTVQDNDTELIWLKNANAFGAMGWNSAMNAAANLSDGDFEDLTDGSVEGDWRLPTSEEWEEFVDRTYYRPPVSNTERNGQWIEGDPFTGIQTERTPDSPNNGALYWSSTGNDEACYLGGYGTLMTGEKVAGYSHYVWPVRDAD